MVTQVTIMLLGKRSHGNSLFEGYNMDFWINDSIF